MEKPHNESCIINISSTVTHQDAMLRALTRPAPGAADLGSSTSPAATPRSQPFPEARRPLYLLLDGLITLLQPAPPPARVFPARAHAHQPARPQAPLLPAHRRRPPRRPQGPTPPGRSAVTPRSPFRHLGGVTSPIFTDPSPFSPAFRGGATSGSSTSCFRESPAGRGAARGGERGGRAGWPGRVGAGRVPLCGSEFGSL